MYNLHSQSFTGISPQIDENAFVAPGVHLYGDVRVGPESSLWPGVVARGDVNYISIGKCTNVQDLCCLHVADDHPCIIGDYVTIGHCACVHACEIEDHVLIGMHATILTGAKIGRGSIIAAGALVLANQVIPPNSLVTGVPGKVIRKQDVIQKLHEQALKYKCEWAIEYGANPNIGGEKFDGSSVF